MLTFRVLLIFGSAASAEDHRHAWTQEEYLQHSANICFLYAVLVYVYIGYI